jgi:hypothetical protein
VLKFEVNFSKETFLGSFTCYYEIQNIPELITVMKTDVVSSSLTFAICLDVATPEHQLQIRRLMSVQNYVGIVQGRKLLQMYMCYNALLPYKVA